MYQSPSFFLWRIVNIHCTCTESLSQTYLVLLQCSYTHTSISQSINKSINQSIYLYFQDNLVLSTGLIMKIGHCKEIRISLRNSLWWPIHISNSAEETKLSSQYTPHRLSTKFSLETYPLIFIFVLQSTLLMLV